MKKIVSAKVIMVSWDKEPLFHKALLVEDGKVAALGEREVLVSQHPEAEVFDFPEGLILPGLANTHTHASMTIFRGLADDLPLMTWLEKYIFPVEKHLRREWVYWGAKLAIAEMLRSGVTVFADMYLFEPEVIRAVEEAGIRAALGEGLFDFPSPGYGPLEKGLALTEELLRQYEGHPRINILVCPHATYTCSPETLKKAKEIADRFGALVHIHLSETKEEVSLIKARYGRRPPAHLDELGLLDDRLLVAHAVQLVDEEIELFARKGVRVAHCPESNLKLGSGVAPVVALLEAGVTTAIGTDGPASNNDLDLLTELRTAALVQKGLSFDPTRLPAKTVFRMATELGAEALDFKGCGRLEPGWCADLAVVDLGRPHLTPLHDPLSLLVYSARGGDVEAVMVDGNWIMRGGRVLTFDEEEARLQVQRIGEEIRSMLRK
ncbi:MAG: amidohydrolase [Thermodesulfobacteria bacterium]|nr:amidohydrolase [Thermodesulfobacteriota bacterium]